MSEADENWWEKFFEAESWLRGIEERTPPEQTRAEVEFIVKTLELEPGDRILDLACGHGRHSRELAKRGYDVIGQDLSPKSIAIARELASDEGVAVEFVLRDMREIPYRQEFDAVINMFTAFGYFPTKKEDQWVLDSVAVALKPGGRFLIDFVNPVAIFRKYERDAVNQFPDGAVRIDRRHYDPVTGRNEVATTWIQPDGAREEIAHSIRMYTFPELAELITEAGLKVNGSWGDIDEQELHMDSKRLMIRAKKE